MKSKQIYINLYILLRIKALCPILKIELQLHFLVDNVFQF